MTFYNRNGVLYVRINGKRVSTKLKDTKENRRLVKSYNKHDEFFKKMNIVKNVPTVVELCQEVLDNKVVKNTSFEAYKSLLNSRIIPFFSSKLVNEIKPKHIEQFYLSFEDGSTLNTCLALLKPAFKNAVIREYILTSPLNDVNKPKFKSVYSVNPFSIDEINLILSKDFHIKNLLGVLFFTGMRIGEVLGLKWSDIDFDNFEISIKRTITKGFIQTPKTKSSLRTIDLLPQAEQYLRSQRIKTGLSEFVFVSVRNNYYKSSTNLLSDWKKVLTSCNLEYRELYQARHSFASNMLSNGEDLLWVSTVLGHRSASITLDKYGRYIRKKRERKQTFLDTKSTHYG